MSDHIEDFFGFVFAFDDVLDGAKFESFLSVTCAREICKDNNRDTGDSGIVLHLFEHLDTVESGHHDV